MGISFKQDLEQMFRDVEGLMEPQKAEAIRRRLKESAKDNTVRLLMYGMYNAGKTSLLNALAGETLFPVGSTPTTLDFPQKVFGEYMIIDSPGLGAPGVEQDELSRRMAHYDADIVVFVVSNSDMEYDEVWKEAGELAGRGKAMFVVVNEKQAMDQAQSSAVNETIRVRLDRLRLEHPYAHVEGPFMVNALSALGARSARPVKRLLEEDSRIAPLEEAIRHVVKDQKHVEPLVNVAAMLMEWADEHILVLDREIGAVSEQTRKVMDTLKTCDQLRREFEEKVAVLKQERIADMESAAHGVQAMDPDNVDQYFGHTMEMLHISLQSMAEQARSWLNREARWRLNMQAEPAQTSKFLAPGQDPEIFQDDDMPIIPDTPDLTGPEAISGNKTRLPLTTTAIAGARALERAGLHAVAKEAGAIGRALSKTAKVLPMMAYIIDVILVFRDIKNEQAQLEARKAEIRRRSEERERQLKEARQALETHLRRGLMDALDLMAEDILSWGITQIAGWRSRAQEELDEFAGVSDAKTELQRIQALRDRVSEFRLSLRTTKG